MVAGVLLLKGCTNIATVSIFSLLMFSSLCHGFGLGQFSCWLSLSVGKRLEQSERAASVHWESKWELLWCSQLDIQRDVREMEGWKSRDTEVLDHDGCWYYGLTWGRREGVGGEHGRERILGASLWLTQAQLLLPPPPFPPIGPASVSWHLSDLSVLILTQGTCGDASDVPIKIKSKMSWVISNVFISLWT